jgi:hypothetical protein
VLPSSWEFLRLSSRCSSITREKMVSLCSLTHTSQGSGTFGQRGIVDDFRLRT